MESIFSHLVVTLFVRFLNCWVMMIPLWRVDELLELSNVSRSSRFARLQGVQCAMAGRNLYMRFTCSTGDAMGMNMVSKGVQNVLDFLQDDFPDMDVISISGSLCSLTFSV